MKKLLTAACIASLALGIFAVDPETLSPLGSPKSYTKVDYTITSKFGIYYRTPETKYIHTYNENGKEIESVQMTGTDVPVDKVTFQYEEDETVSEDGKSNKKLISKTFFNKDETIIGKTNFIYDDNGDKIAEEYYTPKDAEAEKLEADVEIIETEKEAEADESENKEILSGKITYKNHDNKKEISEYDSEGNLIKKTILTYSSESESPKLVEERVYNGDGSLNYKKGYSYDSSKLLTAIVTFDKNNIILENDVYRYEENAKVPKGDIFFLVLVRVLYDVRQLCYCLSKFLRYCICTYLCKISVCIMF
ncbi:MAG: hypothetical protein K6F69_01210 [Treponema sp.]|nr:hypothetical protein [Treponema sp.]